MGAQLDGSFEHQKHMFKLMDGWIRNYSQFYYQKFCLFQPIITFKLVNKVLVLIELLYKGKKKTHL